VVLRARGLIARACPLLAWEDAGLLIEGGRVVRPLRGGAAVRRARTYARFVDAGDVWLTAGLVDAHAHLELGALAGKLPQGASFPSWVSQLLRLRARLSSRALEGAALRGARRLRATGATTVVDVDTLGGSVRGLNGSPVRIVLCREVLDAFDPSRTRAALARVARRLPRRRLRSEGLAPHASFSASPQLLRGVAALARRRRVPVTIHWSETEDEVRWLKDGGGALAPFLGPSPCASGLELLERAGLLGPRLLLVHGNHPARGEAARLAARGSVLVHCPGSHRWFSREPFPLAHYLRAGVRVALGTDSLASNEELDLLRELALLRSAFPWLRPELAWAMAGETVGPALDSARPAGVLEPGSPADVAAWSVPARGPRAALEALTSARASCVRTWIGGR
jgi:cytosine/adenosine deaminase-related metal-dependent hydrolase